MFCAMKSFDNTVSIITIICCSIPSSVVCGERIWPTAVPIKQMDNVCIDGLNHKTKPGPEDNLHSQCKPWKERSCCTREVTQSLHQNETWYNFNWNHCPIQGKLSPACERHFVQDLCFYECEPNLGPWLVPHNIKIRNTTFKELPLCAKDCDAWFEDCRNDYTCLDNWGKGFDWTTGTNKCPTGVGGPKNCRKFEQIFKNSTYFCEYMGRKLQIREE